MLQTDSTAAVLQGPAMDKVSGKGGKPADDSGAFSQEFEKQVNKSNEPATEPAKQQTAAAQDQSPEKAENADKAQENDAPKKAADEAASRDKASTEAQGKASAEKDNTAESGKNLPPKVAADADKKAVEQAQKKEIEGSQDAEVAGEADTSESASSQLSSLVEKQDKSVKDLLKGRHAEKKTDDKNTDGITMLPLHVNPDKTIAEDKAAANADSDTAVSDGRVRDVLAQRMLAGHGQEHGASAGKQAKGDISKLASIQAGQGRGSQGGFDEMLKMGSTASLTGSSPTAAAPSTPQPAAASVPVAMTLALPVQQQGWDKAMAERVVWMARGNIQEAKLQLNPRDLGPIDIKISMQHDQTHVNFVAHHAATRDAIEAAIPRLRDMMNEQGLNLGQADVSQHSFGNGSQHAATANGGNGHGTGAGTGMDEDMADDTLITQHVGHVSASGVDYFA